MNKLKRNIIKVTITIKLLLSLAMLISILSIGYQQVTFQLSGVPEHEDLLKEKEGVVFQLILFLIPIIISLIVDFKALKNNTLQKKWFLVTSILVLSYIIINFLNGHFSGFLIAISLSFGLLFILFRNKHINEAT
ncbi:hypothetical protein C1A40_05290 [Tamlana carrageenivorans]|uniref:Uncharacterized protein n=2 Tax=Pseudotamlana carrageenivorans TaxID=2069432 RepID=A0A2I7SG90_9FLAO|nr:hypothetical protein C1A40_05290 [Tamlana carrageenivorans]